MLKAIIMQVDHQNMTSLGAAALSSDSTRWDTLDNENAIVARNTLTRLEQHGSLVISPQTGIATGDGSAIQVNASIKRADRFPGPRSRRQDPQPADPLDEGQRRSRSSSRASRVGFQTRVSISDTGGRATSDFEYEKVGMTPSARASRPNGTWT